MPGIPRQPMQPQTFLRPPPGARAAGRETGTARSLLLHTPRLALVAVLALGTAGCASRYAFDVEATKQATPPQPHRSYRLVDARPDARPGDLRFARVAQDVETALSSRGMYAAPEGTTPALIIAVDFGISDPVTTVGTRIEPFYMELPASALGATLYRDAGGGRSVQPHYLGEREVPFVIKTYRKFLRLTARTNGSETDEDTARQAWSVLVTNEDKSDDLRAYARLMVAAAMDHIGDNLPGQRHIVMTRRDGRVTFVAQGADAS